MTDHTDLVKALRWCAKPIPCSKTECPRKNTDKDCACHVLQDAAAAIEELQAEVKRLQDKLCDWCAVCPKERRKPEDCELLSETPVMYGPSCEKKE